MVKPTTNLRHTKFREIYSYTFRANDIQLFEQPFSQKDMGKDRKRQQSKSINLKSINFKQQIIQKKQILKNE